MGDPINCMWASPWLSEFGLAIGYDTTIGAHAGHDPLQI